MTNGIERIVSELFGEKDGSKFAKLKDKLIKLYGAKEREKTLDALIEYAKNGRILHWRDFLMSDIIELAREGERVDFFEWAIGENNLVFWAIDGLLKTAGKNAYDRVIKLALNAEMDLAIRAKAVKAAAVYSKLPFDRDLPADPSYWKAEDLRLSESI
jgi:hypothetical protein